MDFEKKLNRLEEIVTKMERGDLPLEDSLKMFEEGIQLSRDCHKQLDQAEQKVQILLEIDESGEAKTQPFDDDSED